MEATAQRSSPMRYVHTQADSSRQKERQALLVGSRLEATFALQSRRLETRNARGDRTRRRRPARRAMHRIAKRRTGEPHAANFGNELMPIKAGDTDYVAPSATRCSRSTPPAASRSGCSIRVPRPDRPCPIPPAATRRTMPTRRPHRERLAPRASSGARFDARRVAVDARTGKACGTHGFVDLKWVGKWLGGIVSVTSAPAIVRGEVVTSQQVTDGQLRDAPSGAVHGYDAVTGAPRIAWGLQQPGIATVPDEGKTYSLGTPDMWSTAVGDEELGLVYLPMVSAAGDYLSTRPRRRGAQVRLVGDGARSDDGQAALGVPARAQRRLGLRHTGAAQPGGLPDCCRQRAGIDPGHQAGRSLGARPPYRPTPARGDGREGGVEPSERTPTQRPRSTAAPRSST